jgi:hypothetical protein
MINVLSHVVAGFLAAGAPQGVRFDVPVVTVCEALQDREVYDGQIMVVVGRYFRGIHGDVLGQECERSIITDGFVWQNAIPIKGSASARVPYPTPPTLLSDFRWDEELLNAKLLEVQKTTQLGKGFRLPNQWAAVYGRFRTEIPLKTHKVNGKLIPLGFGGSQCGCPALLASPDNGVRILGDK